jgi:actin related protein 2/3 complex subunit 2
MLLLDTGSNIMKDVLQRRFEHMERQQREISAGATDKPVKADLILANFCDYDGFLYHINNPGSPAERNKVTVSLELCGFKVLMERKDIDVKSYLKKKAYGAYLEDQPESGSDLTVLLDFDSEALKGASSADNQKLINELADIKYHVLEAYLVPNFATILTDKPSPLPPQLIIHRSDEAIYVRPLADQVEITYRTKFDDDDDFEMGKIFIQEFAETKVAGPGVRAFLNKPPVEVQSIFNSYDKSRAAYVVLSLRQQTIQNEAKQLNSVKLCLSFRNYLHYHLKCSKAYIHSRMRLQTANFIKILNRAFPDDEKTEKKTISGQRFGGPN